MEQTNESVAVYDLCKKQLDDTFKYGIYVHDYCSRRCRAQFNDRFVRVKTIKELASELIQNIQNILQESHQSGECINRWQREKDNNQFMTATFEDKLFGNAKTFEGTIFEFTNNYKKYEYTIYMFEITCDEFNYLAGTVNKYFGIVTDE